MPTSTLTFNLPEEEGEFKDAQNGQSWRLIVSDFDEYLRAKLKYGNEFSSVDECLQKCREKLFELVSDDYGLSLR